MSFKCKVKDGEMLESMNDLLLNFDSKNKYENFIKQLTKFINNEQCFDSLNIIKYNSKVEQKKKFTLGSLNNEELKNKIKELEKREQEEKSEQQLNDNLKQLGSNLNKKKFPLMYNYLIKNKLNSNQEKIKNWVQQIDEQISEYYINDKEIQLKQHIDDNYIQLEKFKELQQKQKRIKANKEKFSKQFSKLNIEDILSQFSEFNNEDYDKMIQIKDQYILNYIENTIQDEDNKNYFIENIDQIKCLSEIKE
ncbi:hypothetical protein PPERSA_01011 [Pseudocohnilembus persalinus]|uniref:Uncharacterized protein n=1 Tax=Pseudocohnilembus persalinus TaxID=266149 RepID=A0A0V0QV01_PSEPJ|nr:hypothetical protein PPERSA_01011 [Pseudocohnilembus persalinus]|eukprot:KRX05933.1 hypothetical protein PPERSA_01011 [Pseudocohnilembus persalinus]